jgi:hypothetical protein
LQHLFRLRTGRQRDKEVVGSVEHVVDAGQAGLHHADGGHAVARAHASEIERLLDVILVFHPAPQPGDLLGGIRNRKAHALFIEPRERGGRAQRAERGGRPLRAPMRAAHQVRPQRHQQAAGEIISQRHGADDLLTVPAMPFGDGQRGRNRGAARMRFGHGLEIIRLVGMGAHRIRQRRVDRRGAEICPHD